MYYIFEAKRNLIVYSNNFNDDPTDSFFEGRVVWASSKHKVGAHSNLWVKSMFKPVTLFFEETVTQTIKKELT